MIQDKFDAFIAKNLNLLLVQIGDLLMKFYHHYFNEDGVAIKKTDWLDSYISFTDRQKICYILFGYNNVSKEAFAVCSICHQTLAAIGNCESPTDAAKMYILAYYDLFEHHLDNYSKYPAKHKDAKMKLETMSRNDYYAHGDFEKLPELDYANFSEIAHIGVCAYVTKGAPFIRMQYYNYVMEHHGQFYSRTKPKEKEDWLTKHWSKQRSSTSCRKTYRLSQKLQDAAARKYGALIEADAKFQKNIEYIKKISNDNYVGYISKEDKEKGEEQEEMRLSVEWLNPQKKYTDDDIFSQSDCTKLRKLKIGNSIRLNPETKK